MLWGVAGHDQVFEDSDKVWNEFLEVGKSVRTSLGHFRDENNSGDQHAVILFRQERPENMSNFKNTQLFIQ